MNKTKWAAVIAGTLFLCVAAYVAGSYAKEKLIEEAVQEMKRQQEPQESRGNDAGTADRLYPDTHDGRGNMGLLR